MEFSKQVYWSGLPFPSPGDLPDPGIEPRSPALQADTEKERKPEVPASPRGEALFRCARPSGAPGKAPNHIHTTLRWGRSWCVIGY